MSVSHEEMLFWSDFINIYRGHPSLWKLNSKDYFNKYKRAAGYNMLVMKLKQKDECATKDTVARKINNLRSAFRKEHKKVMRSLRSAASDDEVYEPSLWYYKKLLFLQGEETKDDSISEGKEDLSRLSNREGSPEERTSDHTNETIPAPKRHKLNVKNCHPHPSQQQPHHTRQESPTFQPATEDRQPVTEVRQPVTEVRQPATEVKDDISYFADYVGSELRTVTDRRALALAKHNINTILFEATTGLYNKKNGRG
ncbi:uncharacterized protein [Palaemon carinicauda]|uniref:uncharacterized protein isoform X3 n=1 Tax=Palaemon carinicauda TaxID=392227 RepID=UPI0035B57B8A